MKFASANAARSLQEININVATFVAFGCGLSQLCLYDCKSQLAKQLIICLGPAK